MLDPGLGLLEIGTANIDDVPFIRIAQELCTRKRADERNFGRGRDRLAGIRRRGSDRTDDREDLVFGEHLLHRLDHLFRLVAVVGGFQFELAAGDSACAIRFRKSGEKALAHTLAERLGRPFERRDLTEDDPVFGDTLFGERRCANKIKGKD
jgi:hypothetical protein